MPFLGHNHYDGLDVSPDSTPGPAAGTDGDPMLRARLTVRRFATNDDDESMLLELLGLHEANAGTA